MNNFDNAHANCIVALSENKPTVKKWINNKIHPIHHYLWYHFEEKPQPDSFTAYYREKLGVIDESQAKDHINQFNQGNYKTVSFSKIFTLNKISYGIIPWENDEVIIMSTMGNRIKDVESYSAGSGGYRWGCFYPHGETFKYDLMDIFKLNTTDVERFVKKF